MSKMFCFGDIAVMMSKIIYARKGSDYDGMHKVPCLELRVEGYISAIVIKCKTQRELDTLYDTLLEQIEEDY